MRDRSAELPGRDELDSLPGKGKPHRRRAVAAIRSGGIRTVPRRQSDAGVEGGVEQGWMQAEELRLVALRLSESNLSEDLPVALPRRLQALEGGAVFDPMLSKSRIEVSNLHLGGAFRRPGPQSLGCLTRG